MRTRMRRTDGGALQRGHEQRGRVWRWALFEFNRRYLMTTLGLFVVLVLIALYVRDGFVRPFLGDLLVVVLMFTAVRSVLRVNQRGLVLAILAFAFLLEVGQAFRLVERLGLAEHRLAQVVLGSTFDWLDLLAYTLGALLVLFLAPAPQTSSP